MTRNPSTVISQQYSFVGAHITISINNSSTIIAFYIGFKAFLDNFEKQITPLFIASFIRQNTTTFFYS
jgi:hypothetical protein